MYTKTGNLKIKGEIRRYEPISPYLTIKAGGRVNWFVIPECIDDILDTISFINNEGYDWFVLGNGSKVLIPDRGFDGVVIYTGRLKGSFLEGNILIAESGSPIGELISISIKHNLSGLESLVGIPGSIGGAVIMNAGTRYGSIGDIVETVEFINSEGTYIVKSSPYFEYRGSEFRGERVVLTRVTLRLKGASSDEIREKLSLAVLLRKNQPKYPRQFGSTFKNPPSMSAGRLIEEAGLKGFTYRNVQVSPVHANFILNFGNSADDIYYVINTIQDRVYRLFDIKLEPEVNLIGF
ncbi:MAG: UDP-N-acetylmuramate dehydrogenase [bacterium]|nr:UDP-N-acetylmuramate dehydrogenase [bacterium]